MRPTASMIFGLQQRDLSLQVRQALRDLFRLRIAVVRRPALQHVGDEHLLALQSDAAQHRIEQSTRPAHEGLTLAVFVCTGRLAHHEPAGGRSPTPNTVRVRHWCSPQRVQAATSPAMVVPLVICGRNQLQWRSRSGWRGVGCA